jgi:protein ImuB
MSNGALPLPESPRRILALWLPYLSTDRLHRQNKGKSWRLQQAASFSRVKKNAAASVHAVEPPLAVVAKVKNALRLTAVDETAFALGLSRGTALADARALIPALAVADTEPTAEVSLLEAIADWAERYTPLVALDENGLFLDISGCAHLFGGETALAADLTRHLLEQGFLAQVAIADTPGTAWAVSRFAGGGIVASKGAAEALAALPLAALRLDAEIVSAMERIGLKRIGQILDAPRAPLAARFGTDLMHRLHQALAIDEEAINPRRPPPLFIAERRFGEPISHQDDIAATLSALAATLSASLERHAEGARQMEYVLFRVDGVVTRIVVNASRPIRAPKVILALFREKFAAFGDEIDAGFGFDMARLAITVSAAMDPAQADLAGEANAEADVGALLDRIGARLGEESVTTIVSHASHIPERAAMLVAHGASGSGASAPDAPATKRPLRLFARPETILVTAGVPDGPPVNFRWRRATYSVVRAEGPERIASEWWDESGLTRDYFRVEDAAGHRFWLYRDGLYSEGTNPQWYVHGIFG